MSILLAAIGGPAPRVPRSEASLKKPARNHEIERRCTPRQPGCPLNEWWAAPSNKMPRDDDDDAIAEPKDDSLTYLVRKLRALLRSEAKDQSLRDLFEKLDKNGDKKVTAVELRKGLKDLGFRLDDDEVRDIIKYCDVDGDGEISYLEFESFVESPECKDADVQDVLGSTAGNRGRAKVVVSRNA